MTRRLSQSRRVGLTAGLVAAVLVGGVLAAGAQTPSPSSSPSQAGTAGPPAQELETADEAAKAQRKADQAQRKADQVGRKAGPAGKRGPADGGVGEGAGKAGPPDRKAAAAGPEFVCDPTLNHGQNVSAYARSLPKGPGRGRLVSQAARSDCGKTTTDD